MSWEILRGQVPLGAISTAEWFIRGLPDDRPRSVPENGWHRDILQLLAYLPAQSALLETPHIVWHTADSETLPAPHIDEPRASGSGDVLLGEGQLLYDRILGVAITEQTEANGAVLLGRYGTERTLPAAVMEPGDVLSFSGDQYHMTGPGKSPEPRIVVYFRFLPWPNA